MLIALRKLKTTGSGLRLKLNTKPTWVCMSRRKRRGIRQWLLAVVGLLHFQTTRQTLALSLFPQRLLFAHLALRAFSLGLGAMVDSKPILNRGKTSNTLSVSRVESSGRTTGISYHLGRRRTSKIAEHKSFRISECQMEQSRR
jgi:hypothetical protein